MKETRHRYTSYLFPLVAYVPVPVPVTVPVFVPPECVVFISASDVSMSFLPSHIGAARPVTFRIGSALSSVFFFCSQFGLLGWPKHTKLF
jgi:hypothetical protein